MADLRTVKFHFCGSDSRLMLELHKRFPGDFSGTKDEIQWRQPSLKSHQPTETLSNGEIEVSGFIQGWFAHENWPGSYAMTTV